MSLTVTKPARSKPDWKLIESLYLQGYLPAAISAKTGVNARVISVHLSRHGVSKQKQQALEHADPEVLSRATRSKLAIAADKLADCLQDPPKSLERQVLYADVLQKNAKTASLVHGWGEGSAVAVVVAGMITDQPADGQAIDIDSEVGTNTAPEQVD